MKHLTFALIMPFMLNLSAKKAFSMEEPQWALPNPLITSVAVSISPLKTLLCLFPDNFQRTCLEAFVTAPTATVTTVLLLKEMETAKPDAINYVAGGSPSPLLYDVVSRLQTFFKENTGGEISFDEAVNGIITN